MLDQIAAFGPFFALDIHDAGLPAEPPWRPMGELTDDPAVLLRRVTAVRSALAATGGRADDAVELRVAASVAHLGLTARLLSPALALAVLGNTRPFDLAQVRWQAVPGGAFPLSLPREHLRPGGTATPSEPRWAAALVDGPLQQLALAAGTLSVSPRILWGNVASAVNGAATVLANASPAHAQRTRDLATLLLSQPPLRDAATGATGTRQFRRRSCCLIYRAAPPTTLRAQPIAARALCGDCVLR